MNYIELRAKNGWCIATGLDGFVLYQVRVPCEGEGTVLICPTRVPKCNKVSISDSDEDRTRFAYYGFGDKLMYAVEYPAIREKFLNWSKILPYDRKGDVKIVVNPKLLRKALEAFGTDMDCGAVCLSIPENPLTPIAITAANANGIVLPMRMNHPDESIMSLRNWYDVEEAKSDD